MLYVPPQRVHGISHLNTSHEEPRLSEAELGNAESLRAGLIWTRRWLKTLRYLFAMGCRVIYRKVSTRPHPNTWSVPSRVQIRGPLTERHWLGREPPCPRVGHLGIVQASPQPLPGTLNLFPKLYTLQLTPEILSPKSCTLPSIS